MDFTNASIPLGGGCTQYLLAPITIGVEIANANGLATVPLGLPLDPRLRGIQAFAQVATLQSGGPIGGIALSAGLRILVGD